VPEIQSRICERSERTVLACAATAEPLCAVTRSAARTRKRWRTTAFVAVTYGSAPDGDAAATASSARAISGFDSGLRMPPGFRKRASYNAAAAWYSATRFTYSLGVPAVIASAMLTW